MPQIYSTPHGPALLVRTEKTERGTEYVLASVNEQHRMVVTHRHTQLPPEFELIHDPAPRAEANVALEQSKALVEQRAILFDCLASALGRLSEREADEIRDIYREKAKSLGVIPLTEPADLVESINQEPGGA